jgi:aspartyl-tRNA(Asn)/glutamyl-tRNA(Gln) amidotransferase subunit A
LRGGGLKPTYGRVSRYGLIALGSSLDQAGVLTKTIADSATVFQLMAGADPYDSTSLPKAVPDYSKFLKENLKGLKIGVPKEYMIAGLDPEVEGAVKNAIHKMSELGAEIIEISLPHSNFAIAAYYIVLPVEISANLSRFDGIRYGLSAKGKTLEEVYYNTRSQGFGAESKRRIMIGTYASSAGYFDEYYKKAKQAQNLIRRDFTNAFAKCDLIVTPTTPTPAFKFGEKADPLSMYLADIFTVGLNLAGVPGLSMPVGLTKSGLPIGMQLVANHFAEEKLFLVGHALEQSLNLQLKPNL